MEGQYSRTPLLFKGQLYTNKLKVKRKRDSGNTNQKKAGAAILIAK